MQCEICGNVDHGVQPKVVVICGFHYSACAHCTNRLTDYIDGLPLTIELCTHQANINADISAGMAILPERIGRLLELGKRLRKVLSDWIYEQTNA
jgi:hypothetical protein